MRALQKPAGKHARHGMKDAQAGGEDASRKFQLGSWLAGCVLALLAGVALVLGTGAASAGPGALGFPDAATTGVPGGIQLSPSSSIIVTEDGAVIDSLDVEGRIWVKADRVTIRNTRVDANGSLYGIRMDSNVVGLRIEDSEIFNAKSAAVAAGEYLALRVNVHDSRDGLLVSSNTVIMDSWIHDLSTKGVGIKSTGGTNSILQRNTIDASTSTSGAALQLRSKRTSLTGWLINGNLFIGGQHSVRFTSGRHPVNLVRFVDNTWMANSWTSSALTSSASASQWTGNRTTDGAAVIGPDGQVSAPISEAQPAATATATSTATPRPPATATPRPPATATATATPRPPATATPRPPATATPRPSATAIPRPPATATPRPPATATPRPAVTATPQSVVAPPPPPPSAPAPPPPSAPLPVDPPPGGECVLTVPNNPTDDPNPAYNGSFGRYPNSTSPVPPGFPTPLTTGLCGAGIAVSDLTRSGGLRIQQDGAVIDMMDIVGGVKVEANNVTIRRSRITATSRYSVQLMPGYNNLLIEDTRIRADGEPISSAIYLQGSATLRRLNVSGGTDSLKSNSGELTVLDSYFSGNYRKSGSHNDVVQLRAGSNYLFRGNSLIGPWQMSTSVFITSGANGPMDNLVIEDNYLSGGGYTIYTGPGNYGLTNAFVRNNRVEIESWQHGWASNRAGNNAVYEGNQFLPS